VMTGTIPPGVSVPLHSHPDIESFFLVSGAVQVMSQRDGKFKWFDVRARRVCSRFEQRKTRMAKHVERASCAADNNHSETREILSTDRGPVTAGVPLPPPTFDDLQHFMRVAAKYNYWLGSPAENAAIGIVLSIT
jgi:hypothetical protein